MDKKYTDPQNILSIFDALTRERGEKRYCLSDEDRQRGDALLAEWRSSSPLDDRQLGVDTILAALWAHPEDAPVIRVAAGIAPEDVQSLLLMHGLLEGVARDGGKKGRPLVRLLF